MSVGPADPTQVTTRSDRSALTRFGPVVVTLAILLALTTMLVFAGLTPLTPSDEVVLALFGADGAIILVLLAMIAREVWRLLRARREGAAAARLHIRIVALFSIVAAAPAVVMAIVASLVIERGLNPAFLQDMRGFVQNTAEAGRLYRESQCKSLVREGDLTAADLDRALPAFNASRAVFNDFFSSRARFLGFSTAAMIRRDGAIVEQPPIAAKAPVVKPEPRDFDDAAKGEALCLVHSDGRVFVALRPLQAYPDTFLYVARELDSFAVEFPQEASNVVALFDAFGRHRANILIAFAVMFIMLAAIMLLSAIWLGLSFANRLVGPIRRLIRATDAVSGGNLYVQVPVKRSEGDLAHLGETFNKMTSELRVHQNGLIEANRQLDERRAFTEAVLAGVPAAVVGVDGAGAVTVLNPAARALLAPGEEAPIGRPLAELAPELSPLLGEAGQTRGRLFHAQTSMSRRGRERVFNVRIAAEQPAAAGSARVITLDDITDLVSAQRTAAWADVARRIAHEIKNPLTPIQLSAERIKRKYGKVITTDREVFDQCTDTIVRQVDDIKRMVDEFSSFARMPKARPARDDLAETVRQALFLMRVGHPAIAFEDDIPAEMPAVFDRRLLSQALTNVIKNATEGLAAATGEEQPRIAVRLSREEGVAMIDIIDNGKGFPAENRQRLFEPYMTTRAEGTGLGLPIVLKILEDHGGGIDLLDAADSGMWEKGAWVRMRLPLAGPLDLADEAAPANSAQTQAASKP